MFKFLFTSGCPAEKLKEKTKPLLNCEVKGEKHEGDKANCQCDSQHYLETGGDNAVFECRNGSWTRELDGKFTEDVPNCIKR